MNELESKSEREIMQMIGGAFGTPYIKSADNEVSIKCHGFKSWDDTTVISSLKDAEDVEHISTTRLATVPIPKGELVTFGFVASKITLSAGSGTVLRSEPIF